MSKKIEQVELEELVKQQGLKTRMLSDIGALEVQKAQIVGSFAQLLADAEKREIDKNEIECLALNIYFETRAVSLADAIAVSDVVMNRINSARYPNTVCEVVKQGHQDSQGNMLRHKCQFSWYCDGKSDKTPDTEAYEKALMIAHGVYYGNLDDFVEGATHYHATYVLPEWAESKTPIVQIGEHIFYRWD